VEYGSPGFTATPQTDTYTIVSPAANYRTSNSATTLNSSSTLVKSAGNGATTGCMDPVAGEHTFYADAVASAQSQLATFKSGLGAAGANSQNVIILLSDGDANAQYSASGHSDIVQAKSTNECHAAITAASNAKATGTWVYVVGYGANTSASSSCGTDSPAISAYCTLAQMSSQQSTGRQYFYADAAPPASCPGVSWTLPAASANIANAFTQIAQGLASVRLIPACAYSTSLPCT
jgi:hypothetical protein